MPITFNVSGAGDTDYDGDYVDQGLDGNGYHYYELDSSHFLYFMPMFPGWMLGPTNGTFSGHYYVNEYGYYSIPPVVTYPDTIDAGSWNVFMGTPSAPTVTATSDIHPPVVSSVTIDTTGAILTINWTETDSPPVVGTTGLRLLLAYPDFPWYGFRVPQPTSVSTTGTTTTATLSPPMSSGVNCVLNYSPGNFADSAGAPNTVVAFTGQVITNNSTVSGAAAYINIFHVSNAGSAVCNGTYTYTGVSGAGNSTWTNGTVYMQYEPTYYHSNYYITSVVDDFSSGSAYYNAIEINSSDQAWPRRTRWKTMGIGVSPIPLFEAPDWGSTYDIIITNLTSATLQSYYPMSDHGSTYEVENPIDVMGLSACNWGTFWTIYGKSGTTGIVDNDTETSYDVVGTSVGGGYNLQVYTNSGNPWSIGGQYTHAAWFEWNGSTAYKYQALITNSLYGAYIHTTNGHIWIGANNVNNAYDTGFAATANTPFSIVYRSDSLGTVVHIDINGTKYTTTNSSPIYGSMPAFDSVTFGGISASGNYYDGSSDQAIGSLQGKVQKMAIWYGWLSDDDANTFYLRGKSTAMIPPSPNTASIDVTGQILTLPWTLGTDTGTAVIGGYEDNAGLYLDGLSNGPAFIGSVWTVGTTSTASISRAIDSTETPTLRYVHTSSAEPFKANFLPGPTDTGSVNVVDFSGLSITNNSTQTFDGNIRRRSNSAVD